MNDHLQRLLSLNNLKRENNTNKTKQKNIKTKSTLAPLQKVSPRKKNELANANLKKAYFDSAIILFVLLSLLLFWRTES